MNGLKAKTIRETTSDSTKPRLLFLRFTRRNLPAFIRLHLDQQVACLSQFFSVTTVEDQLCDYRELCRTYSPDISIFESGVYVARSRSVANVGFNPEVPKLGFIHCDAFCPTRKIALDDMTKWGIDTYFTTAVSLGAYTSSISDRLFVWPNFVDVDLYRDYGLPKIIPFLFTGSQAIHYPWRSRINRVISQNYPTLQCPHFGWEMDADRSMAAMPLGEPYARMINAAMFAPTCGTFANDLVRKHFEIPACNACLITEDTESTRAAGFVDRENCVFATDKDVLEKVGWLLQRTDDLARLTKAGHELVSRCHTMRNRDQVFQWYTLHKLLKPGQRIVQPGPFLPLTIVDAGSNRKDSCRANGAIDRLLMARADEKFWDGRYQESEGLYRRCRNYYVMPEPALRIALCRLHQGDPQSALNIVTESITSMMDRSGEGAQPDPVEWAYLILALICQGKLSEAVTRTSQYPGMRHVELDRIRCLIQFFSGKQITLTAEQHVAEKPFPSIHELPRETDAQWLARVKKVLRACGQMKSADSLDGMMPSAISLSCNNFESTAGASLGNFQKVSIWQNAGRTMWKVPDVSTMTAHFILARIRLRGAVRKRLKRVILPFLRKCDSVAGPFLPYKWSAMSTEQRSLTVRKIFVFEEIRSMVLLGAAARSWLTEASLAGIAENPTLPSVLCVSDAASKVRRLQRRPAGNAQIRYHVIHDFNWLEQNGDNYDAVVIDCSELSDSLKPQRVPTARVVVLNDIVSKVGSELWQSFLRNRNYILVTYELLTDGGYAIFRRACTMPWSR